MQTRLRSLERRKQGWVSVASVNQRLYSREMVTNRLLEKKLYFTWNANVTLLLISSSINIKWICVLMFTYVSCFYSFSSLHSWLHILSKFFWWRTMTFSVDVNFSSAKCLVVVVHGIFQWKSVWYASLRMRSNRGVCTIASRLFAAPPPPSDLLPSVP